MLWIHITLYHFQTEIKTSKIVAIILYFLLNIYFVASVEAYIRKINRRAILMKDIMVSARDKGIIGHSAIHLEKVYSLDRIICLLSMHYFPLLYTTTIRNWHYTFPFVAIFLVVKVSYILSISFRNSLSISLKYSLSFKTNAIELIFQYVLLQESFCIFFKSFWQNTPTELTRILSLLICFWLPKILSGVTEYGTWKSGWK